MRVDDLSSLVELAASVAVKKRAALVAAHESHVLESSIVARRQGIVDSVLIGQAAMIEELLAAAGENAADYTIIDASSH